METTTDSTSGHQEKRNLARLPGRLVQMNIVAVYPGTGSLNHPAFDVLRSRPRVPTPGRGR